MTDASGGLVQCSAVLFDLDGVLIDSRLSIERCWRAWAARKQVDADFVLGLAHGRRTVETIELVAPHLDLEVEVAELARAELEDLDGTVAMPGAQRLLRALPPDRWAIVTSGLSEISRARLRHAGLPEPDVLVTAEQIARGKPSPDGYLAAAERLRVPRDECVVVEDAPPGVAAARSAGMRVIGVLTTYDRQVLGDAQFLVPGVHAINVVSETGKLELAWSYDA